MRSRQRCDDGSQAMCSDVSVGGADTGVRCVHAPPSNSHVCTAAGVPLATATTTERSGSYASVRTVAAGPAATCVHDAPSNDQVWPEPTINTPWFAHVHTVGAASCGAAFVLVVATQMPSSNRHRAALPGVIQYASPVLGSHAIGPDSTGDGLERVNVACAGDIAASSSRNGTRARISRRRCIAAI